ncbi:hypothetical protein ACS0TY_006254 [Phlomoides rotata]
MTKIDLANIVNNTIYVTHVDRELHIAPTESSGSDGEKDHVDLENEFDFDEGRVSDEENEDEVYPMFNPNTSFKPTFVIGQIFVSKKEFKFAAQSHAIKCRRNINFPKNDDMRLYAKCKAINCDWNIHCLKRVDEQSFQIRSLNDNHTCAPSHKVKNLTSTWLSENFFQKFQSDGRRNITGFMLDASHKTRCQVTRQQAYKAKQKALKKIEGDSESRYAKLWGYDEELRKNKPRFYYYPWD